MIDILTNFVFSKDTENWGQTFTANNHCNFESQNSEAGECSPKSPKISISKLSQESYTLEMI